MCIEVTVVGPDTLRVRVVGTSYWNELRPGQTDVFSKLTYENLAEVGPGLRLLPNQSRYPAFDASAGPVVLSPSGTRSRDPVHSPS